MKPLLILVLDRDPERREDLWRSSGEPITSARAATDGGPAAQAIGGPVRCLVLDLRLPRSGVGALRRALSPAIRLSPNPSRLSSASPRAGASAHRRQQAQGGPSAGHLTVHAAEQSEEVRAGGLRLRLAGRILRTVSLGCCRARIRALYEPPGRYRHQVAASDSQRPGELRDAELRRPCHGG